MKNFFNLLHLLCLLFCLSLCTLYLFDRPYIIDVKHKMEQIQLDLNDNVQNLSEVQKNVEDIYQELKDYIQDSSVPNTATNTSSDNKLSQEQNTNTSSDNKLSQEQNTIPENLSNIKFNNISIYIAGGEYSGTYYELNDYDSQKFIQSFPLSDFILAPAIEELSSVNMDSGNFIRITSSDMKELVIYQDKVQAKYQTGDEIFYYNTPENIYNIALYTVKSFSNNAIPDTTWD